jgi:hypothetical protein
MTVYPAHRAVHRTGRRRLRRYLPGFAICTFRDPPFGGAGIALLLRRTGLLW